MLSLSTTTRIFVATQFTDMRKSFDGLLGLVQQHLQQDPLAELCSCSSIDAAIV
jgi:hypothetical protein